MYRYITVLFCAVVAFSLVACDPSKTTVDKYYDNIESTDLSSENINSIYIGSSIDQVKEVMGDPFEKKEVNKPKETYYIYGGSESSDEFTVSMKLDDGVVTSYYFCTGHVKTAKGIVIGDNIENIVYKYGEHYYERNDDGMDILGYFDKENDLSIEFQMRKDKVNLIFVSH
jgi:outer membrane protein assembly factor BamE (lipoprotein component of BamABCDE complex)